MRALQSSYDHSWFELAYESHVRQDVPDRASGSKISNFSPVSSIDTPTDFEKNLS